MLALLELFLESRPRIVSKTFGTKVEDHFISGFDLTTRDLYFTILVEVFTNYILAENTHFTNLVE